ncbi:hypothetical protein Tco_0426806, partial [Tanacetum coccineum]
DPRGLVYLLYVIKSLQSSMILLEDHVSRAVISARLQLFKLFRKRTPTVDRVSELHVSSSGCG